MLPEEFLAECLGDWILNERKARETSSHQPYYPVVWNPGRVVRYKGANHFRDLHDLKHGV